jgi:hypothetical protein
LRREEMGFGRVWQYPYTIPRTATSTTVVDCEIGGSRGLQASEIDTKMLGL